MPGLLLAVLFSMNAGAQGNLLLTPKRLVFEGAKRSEEINLVNIGKDTATYAISFVQIRMKEDGSVEHIIQPDSGQYFADKNLRFFPRTVTLAPKEAQSIKVQLIRASELKPGEYRSHFYFRAIPKQNPLGDVAPAKDSSISIRLTPIFGITMAAIVRIGENDGKVNLSEASLNLKKDTSLNLTFNRTGSMSVYGDVTVQHISKTGIITQVGIVKGLAVYTPNTIRRFCMSLDKTVKVNYRSGKLRVLYTDQSPKPAVLAETEIELN